jgi:hypothetical protein
MVLPRFASWRFKMGGMRKPRDSKMHIDCRRRCRQLFVELVSNIRFFQSRGCLALPPSEVTGTLKLWKAQKGEQSSCWSTNCASSRIRVLPNVLDGAETAWRAGANGARPRRRGTFSVNRPRCQGTVRRAAADAGSRHVQIVYTITLFCQERIGPLPGSRPAAAVRGIQVPSVSLSA